MMKSQITGLRVAGVVFALLALAQLLRVTIRPEILVGGRVLPLWPSLLGIVILGSLSVWMWNLAGMSSGRRGSTQETLIR
jgi:hypothetical protein